MAIFPKQKMNIRRIEQLDATSPAISSSDVLEFLPINDPSQTGLINALILSATQMVEDFLGSSLINKQFVQTMEWFPNSCSVELLFPPLYSIDEIVTIDTDNVETVYSSDNYTMDNSSSKYFGRVLFNNDLFLPSITGRCCASFKVTFTAGYGENMSDIPESIRQAIIMLVMYMYSNRGCMSPNPIKDSGALSLLVPFKTIHLHLA